MTLVAALDFGTSSVKAALIADNGTVVSAASAEYPTHTAPGGVVEQDPGDWWNAAGQALAQTRGREDVAALGLTGQMQTLILVNEESELRPAIVYSDTRATAEHEALQAVLPNWATQTGNAQDPTNVAAKLRWVAENEPTVFAAMRSVLLSAHAYVTWRATGAATCDITTASTTGLLDGQRRDWAPDVLDAVGLRRDSMPELIVSPVGVASGALRTDAADELGLPAGIPVTSAWGDAGSTTDGLVGTAPGASYIYLGTSGWVARIADEWSLDDSVHALAMPDADTRLVIGAVLSAGSAAEWARSTFFPNASFAELDQALSGRRLATRSPLLCLPALIGERAPVRSPDARGVFVGISTDTEPADLYMAVLVGVAMALRHVAGDRRTKEVMAVGGGSSSTVWRQLLADVFDCDVLWNPASIEPGLRSAAHRAFEGADIPTTIEPFAVENVGLVRTQPSDDSPFLTSLLPFHRSLYERLLPTFSALAITPTQKGKS